MSPSHDPGRPLPDWRPPPFPAHEAFGDADCQLMPLDPAQHGPALFAAFSDPAGFDYLPYGPFPDQTAFADWLDSCSGADPQFYVICTPDKGTPLGVASYLRITPAAGSIEVGHIHFGPAMQRRRIATAAMRLMMARAFDLGYRRYEWKCNALNNRSCRAARRLGFAFEGLFRQAAVIKGHNRDTAWFSILDTEWPTIARGFSRWFDQANFDADGQQHAALSDLIATELSAAGFANRAPVTRNT